MKGSVRRSDVERLGIEAVPRPFGQLLVLWMIGRAKRLEDVFVAGDAATVLRRAGTATGQDNRIARPRNMRQEALEHHVVQTVAVVVFVKKILSRIRDNLAEPRPAFILPRPREVKIGATNLNPAKLFRR
jgi:hypothetical protein